jgi:hypothetical protein
MGKTTTGQRKLSAGMYTDNEIRAYSVEILREFPKSSATFIRDKIIEKERATVTLSRLVHLLNTSYGFLSEHDVKTQRRRIYTTFRRN